MSHGNRSRMWAGNVVGAVTPTTEIREGGEQQILQHLLELKQQICGPPISEIAFDRFASEYIDRVASRLAKRTVETKRSHVRRLVRFFGSRPISSITPADLLDLRDSMGRAGLNSATSNRNFSTLSVILEEARARNHARENPMRDIKRARETKRAIPHLPTDDQRRLIRACFQVDLRCGASAWFLLETGLRTGEFLRMLWDRSISFDPPEIFVADSKTGSPRRVPMSPAATRALIMLRRARDERGDCWSLQHVSPWKDHSQLGNYFRRARKQVGLDWIHVHDLRHLRAVNWELEGHPLPRIKRWLGHTNLTTTAVYADHVESAELSRDVALGRAC